MPKYQWLACFLLSSMAVACVGDNPTAADDDDDQSSSGQPGGSSGQPTSSSGGSSSGESSSGDNGDGGSSSSGALPDAGALTLTVAELRVARGETLQVPVQVLAPADAVYPIAISLEGLPANVQANGVNLDEGETTATLTLTATAAAALSRGSDVQVVARSSNTSGTVTTRLVVRGARGELDTSYGNGGSAAFDAQHASQAPIYSASAVHDKQLYMVGRTNDRAGGNNVVLTVVNRLGQAQGGLNGDATVRFSFPAGFTAQAATAALAAPSFKAGALAVSGRFISSTTHAVRGYRLPLDGGNGAWRDPHPSSSTLAQQVLLPVIQHHRTWGNVDTPPVWYMGIGPYGGSHNAANSGFNVLQSVGGNGLSSAPWGGAPAQKCGLGSGENPSSIEGGRFPVMSASDLYVALGDVVQAPVGYRARVWVQALQVGAACNGTTLTEDAVAGEPPRLSMSEPDSQDRRYFALQTAAGTSCVYTVRQAGAPVKLACRAGGYLTGVYALHDDRVLLITSNGTVGSVRAYLLNGGDNSPAATAAGWPEGGVSLPNVPLNVSAVQDDEDGGVFIISAGAAPWSAQRYFVY